MTDVPLGDIHKIKAILRFHGLHEGWCASRTSADGTLSGFPPCNCWLGEDPWDMEFDPPAAIETYRNNAETVRGHRYADGRRRAWRRKHPGWGEPSEWTEIIDDGS